MGGFNLKNPVAKFEYGNIKSTASKVVYGNSLFLVFFPKSICQRCCSGFIYNTLYIQPGNSACILSSLALTVVKICRYSYNRFLYLFAKIIFSCFLHFLKYHGGYLLWGVLLIMGFYPYFTAGGLACMVRYHLYFRRYLRKLASHESLY